MNYFLVEANDHISVPGDSVICLGYKFFLAMVTLALSVTDN